LIKVVKIKGCGIAVKIFYVKNCNEKPEPELKKGLMLIAPKNKKRSDGCIRPRMDFK
jgi:hypothetical protein